MQPDAPDPPDVRRSARRRSAALALVCVLAAAAVLYAVGILVAPTEHANGACTGIGFGCTPSPRDSLLLLGAIAGLPTLLGVLVLGAASTGALLRWTRLPGALAGLVGGLAAGALGVVGVIAALFLM